MPTLKDFRLTPLFYFLSVHRVFFISLNTLAKSALSYRANNGSVQDFYRKYPGALQITDSRGQ
jgi:hypothetical protein